MGFGQRLTNYTQLMRLDRPVGTLLLLWPTLAALWLAANGMPSFTDIAVFALGTFVMRAAGCVINDFNDRNLDGQVERTKNRPMATGAVSELEALLLFGVLATIAFTLLYYLNPFTRYLAVAGILVAALYPLMKRWTYLPQVVLGVAFSWGILMAFAQVNGKLESATGLYFTASLLWIVAYDTWLAMVDREDDIKAGIKSTAILFGEADRLIISILMASCLFALILLGQMKAFGVLYYLGLVVVAGLFIRQLMTTRSKDTAAYFAAFKNNIWVGFVIFVSVVMETLAGPSLQNLAQEFFQ